MIKQYRNVEDLGFKGALVKMEIRGFTVKFSKIKARKKRGDEESSLQKRSINYSSRPKKIKKITDKLYVNSILLKLVLKN